jgi:hypothetical protein
MLFLRKVSRKPVRAYMSGLKGESCNMFDGPEYLQARRSEAVNTT